MHACLMLGVPVCLYVLAFSDLNLDRFAQDCFSHNLTGSDIQGVIQAVSSTGCRVGGVMTFTLFGSPHTHIQAVQRSIRRRIAARKAGQEVKVWPLSADCVEAAMR